MLLSRGRNWLSIVPILTKPHIQTIATRLVKGRSFEVTLVSTHTQTQNFEQVVLPHLDAAYNLARWLTGNARDAEDVVQDAYLRAFRFFPGFRGDNSRPWLMKIVRNACYTWLHTNRPLQDAAEFDEKRFPTDSLAVTPEELLLQNDRDTLVRKALEKLPTNFREALVLRELQGLSYREIADITGMPPGTVMSTLSRARGRLRQVLLSLMDAACLPVRGE